MPKKSKSIEVSQGNKFHSSEEFVAGSEAEDEQSTEQDVGASSKKARPKSDTSSQYDDLKSYMAMIMSELAKQSSELAKQSSLIEQVARRVDKLEKKSVKPDSASEAEKSPEGQDEDEQDAGEAEHGFESVRHQLYGKASSPAKSEASSQGGRKAKHTQKKPAEQMHTPVAPTARDLSLDMLTIAREKGGGDFDSSSDEDEDDYAEELRFQPKKFRRRANHTNIQTVKNFTGKLPNAFKLEDIVAMHHRMEAYQAETLLSVKWHEVLTRDLQLSVYQQYKWLEMQAGRGSNLPTSWREMKNKEVLKTLLRILEPKTRLEWVKTLTRAVKWSEATPPANLSADNFNEEFSIPLIRHVENFDRCWRWMRYDFRTVREIEVACADFEQFGKPKADYDLTTLEPPFVREKAGFEAVGSKTTVENASILSIFLESAPNDLLKHIHNRIPLGTRNNKEGKFLLHQATWSLYRRQFEAVLMKITMDIRNSAPNLAFIKVISQTAAAAAPTAKEQGEIASRWESLKGKRPINSKWSSGGAAAHTARVAAVMAEEEEVQEADSDDEETMEMSAAEPSEVAAAVQPMGQASKGYCFRKLRGLECPQGCPYSHSPEAYAVLLQQVRAHNPNDPKAKPKAQKLDSGLRVHQTPKVILKRDGTTTAACVEAQGRRDPEEPEYIDM